MKNSTIVTHACDISHRARLLWPMRYSLALSWIAAGLSAGCYASNLNSSRVSVFKAGEITTESGPANPGKRAINQDDIPAIVAHVAALRGLALKQPINVKIVSEQDFLEAYVAHSEALKSATSEGKNSFRLLPHEDPTRDEDEDDSPSSDPKDRKTKAAARTGVLAFYDDLKKVVWVRALLPTWAQNDTNPRGVVAHEIVHALQDQHFGFAELRAKPTMDERLAFKALIEGDAELVRAAFESEESGRPVRRAMANACSEDEHAPDSLVRFGAVKPDIARRGNAFRDLTMFSYIHGACLTSSLYFAGGFAAINRAYATPPSATSEVFHPELYLAGRGAAAFRTPAGPTPIAHTRFGELGTRLFLAEVAPRREAFALATHVLNDEHYTYSETRTAWVTEWSDAASAKKFAELARLEKHDAEGRIRHTHVRGEGVQVVVAENLSDDEMHAVVQAPLLAAPTGALPLGALHLVPHPPSLLARPDFALRVEGNVLHGDAFGVTLQIPAGYTPSKLVGRSRFLASAPSGTVALDVSSEPLSIDSHEVIHLAAYSELLAPGKPIHARITHNEFVDTPLGRGSEFESLNSDEGVHFRSLILPLCQKQASLLLTWSWKGDSGSAPQSFAQSLTAVVDGVTRFCTALAQERHTDIP